jgi:hypothetical protein
MNQDLYKASAYTKQDNKNVTAWLETRNNAAHGHPELFTHDQVVLMFQGKQIS